MGLVSQFASIRKLWAALAFDRANLTGHTPNLTGNGLNIYQLDNTNKFIAYERFDSQVPGTVIVVANFKGNAEDNVTVGFPTPGIWITRFNSDSTTYRPAVQRQSHYRALFAHDSFAAIGPTLIPTAE